MTKQSSRVMSGESDMTELTDTTVTDLRKRSPVMSVPFVQSCQSCQSWRSPGTRHDCKPLGHALILAGLYRRSNA
jgi:hypothetical protein